MGLATTKGGLQLDDRIPPLSGKALQHGMQQQLHAFGNEGTLKEKRRVLVFFRSCPTVDTGNIRSKFRLLERTAQNIRMGRDQFTPGP